MRIAEIGLIDEDSSAVSARVVGLRNKASPADSLEVASCGQTGVGRLRTTKTTKTRKNKVQQTEGGKKLCNRQRRG